MSRVATVKIEYESDLTKAKADWDAYRAYVDSHPITVNGVPITTAGTPQATTALTFGGQTTVGPSAAFAAAALTGAAVASAVRQSITPAGSSTPQPIGNFVMNHPFGPPGSGTGWGSSISGGFASAGAMGSQGAPYIPLIGQGSIWTPAVAASQSGIVRVIGNGPITSSGGPNYGLATTNGGQVGPGAVGSGSRMWVPIGDTPNIGEIGYGAGRRAMRNIPIATIAGDEGGGEGTPDDIGWSYDGSGDGAGGGSGGGASWRKLKARLGRGVAAVELTRIATDLLQTSNQYNIQSAQTYTYSDVVALERSQQTNSVFNRLPWPLSYIGSLGAVGREFATGENANLDATEFNRKTAEANSQASRDYLYSGWQYGVTRQQMQGQFTNDPQQIIEGMRQQANFEFNKSNTEYAKTHTEQLNQVQSLLDKNRRNYFMGKISDAGDGLNYLSGVTGFGFLGQGGQALRDWAGNPDPNGDDREKFGLAIQARDQTTRQHNRDIQQISGLMEASQVGFELGPAFAQLNTAEDIEDRNRRTVASGFRGRMFGRTAAAMDEITADRRAVEDFNQDPNHRGPEWADRRAQNTQSVIASQQQSFQNLQFLGTIPGNAQQVSGYTSFGDFSNQGYRDYDRALQESATGADQIGAAANRSDISGGVTELTAAGLLQVLQNLLDQISHQNRN